MTVDILLATYNGARYLPAQLASLEGQTYLEWRLVARDDGSRDDSPAILEAFRQRYPARVEILPPGTGGGAATNFSALLAASQAPYAMCCDQDDVWDADKIAVSLNAMHKLEEQHGRQAPLLVHTDLRVGDAHVKVIAPSFWRYANLYPADTTTLSRLLVQNVVTGCACLCNHALVALAAPMPAEAVMHDWWLALVASGLGAIAAVPQPTLTYRQHGANAIGAQQFGTWYHLGRARHQLKHLTAAKKAQATAFLSRYRSYLTPVQHDILHTYINLQEQSPLTARYLAWRYGFRKQGFLRQVAAFLFLRQP